MRVSLIMNHIILLFAQQQNQMGNTNIDNETSSQKKDKKIIEKLQFYEEKFSEQFGRIEILKLNEKPVRYYMLYRQSAINDELTRARLQQKLAWYCQLKQHKNIVTIEYVDLQPSLDMCIQKINLDIYAKYYNFTLQNAIQNKTKKLMRFRESDLVYILFSLISVGKSFDSVLKNQFCGWFNLQNVYITPEGFIKVYPFPLNCDIRPNHANGRDSPKKYGKSFLQNEEIILHLSRKTTDTNNSNITASRRLTEKDDLRDIGILIFQLLTLNREKIEVQLYSNDKINNILSILEKEGQLSSALKEIILRLLLNSKQSKYHEIMTIIGNQIQKKQLLCSNTIKLDQGSSISQIEINQKNETLKQLSQHKHLKVGCISVISNSKRTKI